MRIISGKYKKSILKAVPGNKTRPTVDKVKESIFNIIGPYYNGGIALDLFAGSGSLGIEALSRGMEKVIFIDKNKKAISTIYENVESCKLPKDKIEIYCIDANRALKALIRRKIYFDIILLDPPYKDNKIEYIISLIDNNNLLKNDGTIMAEHKIDEILPYKIGTLTKIKNEKYGITSISIYTK